MPASIRFMALIALLFCGYTSVLAQASNETASDTSGTIVENIDASGDWVFYSVREAKLISNANRTPDNWDVAFQGTTVSVNGAMQLVEVGFDQLEEAPEDGYRADEKSEMGTALPSGSGSGWYWYDPSTHLIEVLPETSIVWTTPDGTYAKLEILSFYQNQDPDSGAPRHFTFRFKHQPDGSRSF